MKPELILLAFFSLENGADIGRRFFAHVAKLLSRRLISITNLEDNNPFASRVTIGSVLRYNSKVKEDEEEEDDNNIGVTAELHKKFSSIDSSETVIAYYDCQKSKRKSTMYITQNYICIFSSFIVHKTKVKLF